MTATQVTEPPATFPIIILWCLVQIALNIGNVVKTDKMVRNNGAPLGFLDRNTGELHFKCKTDGVIKAAPVAMGRTVFFGGMDNTFYAVNQETGHLRWKLRTRGYNRGTAPLSPCTYSNVTYDVPTAGRPNYCRFMIGHCLGRIDISYLLTTFPFICGSLASHVCSSIQIPIRPRRWPIMHLQ